MPLALRRYVRCGSLAHGFLRVSCARGAARRSLSRSRGGAAEHALVLVLAPTSIQNAEACEVLTITCKPREVDRKSSPLPVVT